MNPDKVLEPGRTMLLSAFDLPTKTITEGDDLLSKAFWLRDLYCEMGNRTQNILPV